jgi:DNA-binding NarL/FixJ family response regulator
MPWQLNATASPVPWAASPGVGTIHSIDSARRRLRGPASADVIRVLVVGHQAITRAGLRRLLEDDERIAVVGEAASGRQASRLVRRTNPHVVLLDAGRSETELAATTRTLAGYVAVLLLTECDPDDHVLAAIRAGATGVLAKDSDPTALASAVRTLAAGGAFLPPRATRRLITEFVKSTPSTPHRA